MGRALEMAYEKAKRSHFEFREGFNGKKTLVVEDAAIIWSNFSGKPNETSKFKTKPGENRNTNLVLNDEAYEAILAFQNKEGVDYCIHESKLFTDEYCQEKGIENIIVHYLNIKVNMDVPFPPEVKLFTTYKDEKSAQVLDANTICLLDRANLVSVDLVLNCYVSPNFPDRCSMYLRTMYCIQEPQIIFGGKYDEFERPNFGEVLGSLNAESTEEVNPATGE